MWCGLEHETPHCLHVCENDRPGFSKKSPNYTLPYKLHVCSSRNNTVAKTITPGISMGRYGTTMHRHDREKVQASWLTLSLLLPERHAPIVDLRNRTGGIVLQAVLEEQGKC